MIEYTSNQPGEKTTVMLPPYLRDFAREAGINISGTIRNVLQYEYERCRGEATNQSPGDR